MCIRQSKCPKPDFHYGGCVRDNSQAGKDRRALYKWRIENDPAFKARKVAEAKRWYAAHPKDHARHIANSRKFRWRNDPVWKAKAVAKRARQRAAQRELEVLAKIVKSAVEEKLLGELLEERQEQAKRVTGKV